MLRALNYLTVALVAVPMLTGCPTGVAQQAALDDQSASADTQPVAVTTQAVIDSRLCDFIANMANGDLNDELLAAADEKLAGTRLPVVLDRNSLEITEVRTISMSACRARMRVGLQLHRSGIRRDGFGYADIKGTVFAARQWKQIKGSDGQLIWSLRKLACIRNPQVENITLSHTTNVFEAFAELVADHIANSRNRCYEAYSVWTPVEESIALYNVLVDIFAPGTPHLPALTYEML